MLSGGFFSVLDDVMNVVDDVAAISKKAGVKTVTISGDDLAVNSQAVLGMEPEKELKIIRRIATGSLRNKAILAPAGLALGAVLPSSIPLLLMAGGAYFCYEGAHKILHREKHEDGAQPEQPKTPEEVKAVEDKKVKSAVRTDFLLSAEIIAITLGAAAGASLVVQAGVLGIMGVATTVGIYGLVGGIVKIDDIGLHLMKKKGDGAFSKAVRAAGRGIVAAAPKVTRTLEVVGTAAMLMVGGGLIIGGIPAAEHLVASALEALPSVIPHGLAHMGIEGVAGLAAGFVALPAAKVLAPVARLCKKGLASLRGRISRKKEKRAPKNETAPAVENAPPQALAGEPKIKAQASIKEAHTRSAAKKAPPEKAAPKKASAPKKPASKKDAAAPLPPA